MFYPCREGCSCVCSGEVLLSQRARAACAVAFLGHFAPFVLIPELLLLDNGAAGTPACKRWGKQPLGVDTLPLQNSLAVLERSHCMVITRNPAQRMVSHYYEFNHKQCFNGTSSFQQALDAIGLTSMISMTGGNWQINPLVKMHRSVADTTATSRDRALMVFQSCLVGVQERYADFMETLARFVPIPKYNSTLDHLHSHSRPSMEAFNYTWVEIQTQGALADDWWLWRQASDIAAAQHALAVQFQPLKPGTEGGSLA